MEPLKRNLKAQQPAFTISEQIENLKALGLKISDEEFAASFLNEVSFLCNKTLLSRFQIL
jgi:hypothetical protein